MKLTQGQKIRAIDGEIIVVEKFLASGGQGEVYKVNFKGESKALKWYTCKFLDEDAFYANLSKNVDMGIKKGAPSKEFLWPLALTEKCFGSFGYVMDLIPDGYYEIDHYIMALVKFSSFKSAVEACIQINSAFRALHLKGLAYQDLNGGNFVINPETGNVLICDNDNVAPDGMTTGIVGTPGYMAPEVFAGKSLPNKRSDQYSMAVLFFILLCGNHPLEGRRWAEIPCLTDKKAMKLYGTHPLFVYDPADRSNEPVQGVHDNVLMRWQFMPQYIREMFQKAFSAQALMDSNRRVSEIEWLQTLCRFRSDIVTCQNPGCGGEVFISNAASTKCDCCGKMYPVTHKLKLPMYDIPVVSKARIYKCQLGTCSMSEALEPIAIILKKEKEFCVKNKSNLIWAGTTLGGRRKKVEPDSMVPVREGISFEIEDKKIEIITS